MPPKAASKRVPEDEQSDCPRKKSKKAEEDETKKIDETKKLIEEDDFAGLPAEESECELGGDGDDDGDDDGDSDDGDDDGSGDEENKSNQPEGDCKLSSKLH
eukprot:GHVR01054520.1.p1 GENE.GHVR01054520.1~~GHVR01054520.1.p1  ORF type:complete len:102 (+),score=44.57 GHVR01054520.1:64-369(+)